MKKVLSFALVLALMVSINGCKTANNAQKGAGIGTASGAVIGGLIGGNVAGTLIGAAVGGVTGGIIGRQMDKQANRIKEVLPNAQVNRVGEGIQVILDENGGVTFAFDKADLTDISKSNLDKIANVFVEFPDTNLLIEGHTDDSGKADYNLRLSVDRADAVADYLKNKGIDKSRFTISGLGEANPQFDNSTDEGRAKNRRVEIGISANEDMIEEAQANQN